MRSPTTITITRRLENPAIAIIPKVDKTHKTKSKPATWRKGVGNIPMSHSIKRNIKMSQRVIIWPINEKSGKGRNITLPYPNNQKTNKSNKTRINIA